MSLYSLSVFTVIISLCSKEIYSILISNTVNKPTSNIDFEKLFENTTLAWSKVEKQPPEVFCKKRCS